MSSSSQRAGVVPACLSFLAIYNPSLGKSEDSLDEQIVYYYSKPVGQRTEAVANGSAREEPDGQEQNKRLRQIGLAQGMVEFAKSFSNGEAVDSIETEKSRIILHELEAGWWILASIDLTRLISSHDSSSGASGEPHVEYSAREVSSPALLLQHLLRAHQIFLLHHASSLAELFMRTPRNRFCGILKRFWNDFVWDWDVLLNGNPAVDVFNGVKLAAGGELGVGVGEEDWGSGEREVLEDFIGRTEGLVDLLVTRFGDAHEENQPAHKTSAKTDTHESCEFGEWKTTGQCPRPSDGVIFSGIGAVSRPSIRAISQWAETLYARGQDAYGVRLNPTSAYRRKGPHIDLGVNATTVRRHVGNPTERQETSQRNRTPTGVTKPDAKQDNGLPAGIPPSLVGPRRTLPQQAGTASDSNGVRREAQAKTADAVDHDGETGTETMIKYLTLGVYGSKWGIPFNRPPVSGQTSDPRGKVDSDLGSQDEVAGQLKKPPGQFLIGFRGELEGELDEDVEAESGSELEDRLDEQKQNSRTMIRTLHVERVKPAALQSDSKSVIDDSVMERRPDRLRVVVYLRQPFQFIFLFELQTDALAIPSFYRSVHHQLGPLQRPLLTSTSPKNVSERLSEASLPKSTASTKSSQPICDLVFDPGRLTVHTTIPPIPEPGIASAEGLEKPGAPWNRVEALNVHSQILNTYASTRRRPSELERTCKTSRGWWVVWMRLPHAMESRDTSLYREAILIRKASDYTPPAAGKASGRFGRDVSGSSVSGSWGPGKLAEGIGIDARQYIEGLLSLNR